MASDLLCFFLVGEPSVGLPHGVTGDRPGVLLPSPPPCGWSTGFMTVPRTVGLMPRCRLRPALPHLTFWCDWLPTTPMVARHSARTLRRSPLGSLSVTRSPSRAVIWALVPARSEEHTSELQSHS